MPSDVLMTLAQSAGQTVAAAAVTDVWEAVQDRFARLLGRGDARKTQVAERWLAQTREQLTAAAPGSGLEPARRAAAERWAGRFADLLDEDPSVEVELRALVEEVAAQLPVEPVSAADHSTEAQRPGKSSRSGWSAESFGSGMSNPFANDQFVLLNDQPVKELDSEDVLGVAGEVSGLANLIMGSRYSAPFTIGIDADWGMGKSTLMSQLQVALAARGKEGVVTRWFNAWTAQKGDVLAGLIKSALVEVDENALRRLLHRVTRNRGLLVGLRVMFIAAASFLHLGRVVDQLWDFMSVDARSRSEILKDLEDLFGNWAAQTKRTPDGRLLVVFVDDLDRCSTETIVDVCEAMRLYLAVPGIVFVIGCDQDILTRAARRSGMDSQAATSLGFLEKIIQITYHKPAPDEQQIAGLVRYYTELSRAGGLFSEQARQIIMQGTGRNPRRMKRLLNSIILQYRLDPEWGSLGPESLTAVNLLAHFYPEFYRELTRPNATDIIHQFLTYKKLLDRTQRGDQLSDQDRQFFRDNGAPEPRTDDQGYRDSFRILDLRFPTFPGLAGQQEFFQLVSELAGHPKFVQLMDWLQRRAPAKAAELIASADEEFLEASLAASADQGGTAIGTLEYQRRPEVASLPVRLAPRPVFLAGREGLLADLDARLAGEPGQPGPRVAALCGLGGAGKTSVAVEYAHRHLAEMGVCWQFPAEDPALLAAEFAVLAAQLGAREVVDSRDPVASVHAVLARQQAGWLLVFDNVPDRASVAPFVPPAGPGRVLITTQNQHWPPGQAFDVPVLGLEVAAGFLVDRTGDPDRAAARELAVELGGLPLALEQAAAYLQASGTTLASYLPLFRARQADLLTRGEAPGHPGGVAATLGLALSRLAEEAPAAAGLLRLLAFLAPEPVPLALLLAEETVAGRLGPEAVAGVGPLLGDPVAAGDAITALRRYSLVAPAGDGLVLVHRLVQAITRAQLSVEAAGQWEQAAANLVEQAVPADPELPSTWPAYAVLLPHARAVLDLTSNGMRQIAQYLGYSGSYPVARDLFRLITDAYAADDAYGPEHRDTLAARHELATWTGQAGDAAAARDQFAALLPIEERVLGPDHPGTLTTRASLASWTGKAGDGTAARDQFAALLPSQERVLGPDHPGTLTTRGNLASWVGEAGDAAGARDELAALLPSQERVLGPEHPDTLTTRANLAVWTGMAGDAAGARDQFAILLPISERVLGPEHPDTLAARANLASWTGKAGDPAAARDQYALLLPIWERLAGPSAPPTLAARANFAFYTGETGDPAGGRDQYAALIPDLERILGTEHPDTLACRGDLARWTGEAGDAVGARDQFAALLPISERVLGPGHPDTVTTRRSLAYWTGQVGDAASGTS